MFKRAQKRKFNAQILHVILKGHFLTLSGVKGVKKVGSFLQLIDF